MKIYVFGNPLVPEDSKLLEYLPELKKKFPKINFEIVDPNENFPPFGVKDLVIIDTVQGIDKVQMIEFSDLKSIDSTPVSPHDYDLLFHLLLLKKLGKINTVKIIGLPQKNYIELDEVFKLISNIFVSNH
ncbi:MAG: hypothetical protein Q7R95_10815 [bacterium]|nr:hypothetical protein [bacterium]